MNIKLYIPFYASEATAEHPEGIHCVENSLQMILGYFEPKAVYDLGEMERITGKQPEKATWGMTWSIWFTKHGYEVNHYTTFDYDAFMDRGVDYLHEAYGAEIAKWQDENSNLEEARRMTKEFLEQVVVISKKPTIEDIEALLSEKAVIKASVNQRLLNDQDGYIGHSVVITGIDSEYISFHDPGLPAFKDKKMTHTAFQEAMDSFGGEMDVISKK